MSAFTATSVLSVSSVGDGSRKCVVLTATGPSSYDTAGSVLDLSSANTVLSALNNEAVFVAVHSARFVGVTDAASDVYYPTYVRAASGAPATGKFKVRDLESAPLPGVEVGGGGVDLSTITFIFEVVGK